jgi:hypothetical protein
MQIRVTNTAGDPTSRALLATGVSSGNRSSATLEVICAASGRLRKTGSLQIRNREDSF